MSEELRQALSAKAGEEQAPAEEGAPSWMVTFADMMTLLLCFFVLLLSFANQDVQKFQDMMGSVKDAFGVQTQRPVDKHIAWSPAKFERQGYALNQDSKQILRILDSLRETFDAAPEDLRKSIEMTPDEFGVLLRLDSDVLFKPGSATLNPGSDRVLDQIVAVLKKYNYNLVVRGHTDNSKVANSHFPSNWELSAARAATALRYILEKGHFSPERLKAVGYADSQPLVPNSSDANRARNRRVEFYYYNPQTKVQW